MTNTKVKTIVRYLHLWLGLLSGVIVFVVCITGSLYTFRAKIEDAANFRNLYVDNNLKQQVSLDTLQTSFLKKSLTITRIVIHENSKRSLEVYYTSISGRQAGMYYVHPANGQVIGNRNTSLSSFFEFVLQLHKTLLMSNVGKQVVGAAVLVFVFMLLSGFFLWLPRKLNQVKRALVIKSGQGKSRFWLDLHKVPGLYSLVVLFLIALLGLYITYPWVKSAFMVSLGGNPVLSEASDKKKLEISGELGASFSESLARIMAQKKDTLVFSDPFLDNILHLSTTHLPYKAITSITLPTPENSWVQVLKMNRENWLRAFLPDKLFFNKKGELQKTKLFKDAPLNQQFVELSLPMHTGEIMGWPSLILYFLVTLIGASLPITGFVMWIRRKRNQISFVTGQTNADKKEQNAILKTEQENWLIVFSTKSGNSKHIAVGMQRRFKQSGLSVQVKNMKDVTVNLLQTIQNVCIIISTDGEGDIPPTAEKLVKQLSNTQDESLKHLKYTICALGDSSYELFCEAGKFVEKLLVQNKAKPLLDTVYCDVDFAKTAVPWVKNVLNIAVPDGISKKESKEKTFLTDNKTRYRAQVSELYALTEGETNDDCYHLTLKSDTPFSNIKPGDAIEIIPQNPPVLVNQILTKLNLDNGFKEYLTKEVEITSIKRKTLVKYNRHAANKDLAVLLKDEKKTDEFVTLANFYDVLEKYPGVLYHRQLKSILPPGRRRLYSVASCSNFAPNELHLTVKRIFYYYNNRAHEGAGSNHLTTYLNIHNHIDFKHFSNQHFRLPKSNSVPIILIGVGTGIAPFKGFLQNRQHNGIKNSAWLIWGCKTEKNDYLYESELKKYHEEGILKTLNPVFSRDGHKDRYVQDVLRANAKEVRNWMENGAHIYICGSLKMGESVTEALDGILSLSELSSEVLIEQERWHIDVY